MGKVTVIDGGLATELEKHGFNLNNDPLWSARVLHENPDLIVKVHKSYLESGAEVITTASYQASVEGFKMYLNTTTDESLALIKKSVELAKKARDEYHSKNGPKDILIAGSVGSYGAFLADGSEYTGDYCDAKTHKELISWHRPRLEALIDAGVDLIAFETIPSQIEGEALMMLLKQFPSTKAWLSFSCQSLNETAHKENIASAISACVKLALPRQLVAVGVNCCPPQYVESLLKDIASANIGIPLLAYPNSGEKWGSKSGWTEKKADPLASYVNSWLDVSVKYIGGCCRTGPADIAQIAGIVKQKARFHPKEETTAV